MPSHRLVTRLGPPVGDTYMLRQQCRHGKYKTTGVQLAYAVAGGVCTGCLVDHPAVAMFNTRQSRELRKIIELGGTASSRSWGFGPVVGPALDALGRADDLSAEVRRKRRMAVEGMKAGVLMVCSCLSARLVDVMRGEWTPGMACDGCGQELPSVCWLAECDIGDLVEELPTSMDQRRALRAAREPAPIVDYPREVTAG